MYRAPMQFERIQILNERSIEHLLSDLNLCFNLEVHKCLVGIRHNIQFIYTCKLNTYIQY